MPVTCPADLTLLDLITLIILREVHHYALFTSLL
jgi:hypothetical protein